MAELLFYLLSGIALACALGVVLQKSPMNSVIALLGTFFCVALIYLLAGFQFLAAAQVLVYAGAILVLFLFVIMLLDLSEIGQAAEESSGLFRTPGAKASGVAAAVLALATVLVIQASKRRLPRVEAADREAGFDPLEPLAGALFGRYSLPFEAVSLVLLASMVAVLVLARRGPTGSTPEGHGTGAAGTAAPEARDRGGRR